MIRQATEKDYSDLMALINGVGLLEPDEVAQVEYVLAKHFESGDDSRDVWLVDDEDGLISVAYLANERMTNGTWTLLLIAVHPDHRRQGRGEALLSYIERWLADHGQRVLLVETAGLDDFAYVHDFYIKNGFAQEGRIRDFYDQGADKVIFSKTLPPEIAPDLENQK